MPEYKSLHDNSGREVNTASVHESLLVVLEGKVPPSLCSTSVEALFVTIPVHSLKQTLSGRWALSEGRFTLNLDLSRTSVSKCIILACTVIRETTVPQFDTIRELEAQSKLKLKPQQLVWTIRALSKYHLIFSHKWIFPPNVVVETRDICFWLTEPG